MHGMQAPVGRWPPGNGESASGSSRQQDGWNGLFVLVKIHVYWMELSRFKSITSQNSHKSNSIHSNTHVISITEQGPRHRHHGTIAAPICSGSQGDDGPFQRRPLHAAEDERKDALSSDERRRRRRRKAGTDSQDASKHVLQASPRKHLDRGTSACATASSWIGG
jgi:hypothetical protein